ncbi:MAG: PEGA domain-containing protein [Planctomycetaceae bacterium]|nr:PEGA domain-containing protein [Planctomycetaceae bacterium]
MTPRLLLLVWSCWLIASASTFASSATQLYVRTVPSGARVFLDGKSLGSSNDLFAVSPGLVTVAVELDGYKRETRKIEIPPEQITRLELQLEKQPGSSPSPLGGSIDLGRRRDRILLPPAVAGTPLSLLVHAQAHYFEAYGDAVESMAIARRIDAETVSLEIQNSIDAVDAYFKRRELNRTYRKYELDPQAAEQRHQERLKRNVEELYQKTLQSDVTRTLNWLLQELAGPSLAYQYSSEHQKLLNSKLDQRLSPEDLKLIRLTDGGGKIKTLVFTANDGKVLDVAWPFALQAPQFAVYRKQFENARDTLLHEAESRSEISYESRQRLRESVVAIMVALEAAYPRDARRGDGFSRYASYYASKRFLQGLWGSVQRATTVKDLSVFSGRLRFQGDSLVALLQHMYGSGLEFATPEHGGEGVYRKLFHGMRNLYIHVGMEKSETAATGYDSADSRAH